MQIASLVLLILSCILAKIFLDGSDGPFENIRKVINKLLNFKYDYAVFHINQVNCSELGLRDFPKELNYLNKGIIQRLYLSGNKFSMIPQELYNFTDLEELSLDRNQISGQIPTFFKRWTRLSVLNLSSNYIESWTNIGLKTVVRLDLSTNNIGTIDETAFIDMELLSELNLCNNRLRKLYPELFIKTLNLKNLILCKNYFTEIPKFESASLHRLDLSNCRIRSIKKGSFNTLTALTFINLFNNTIKEISNNLSSPTLEVINLSNNNITNITTSAFFSLQKLIEIDLSSNTFNKILKGQFKRNIHLKDVKLDNIPWRCEKKGMNDMISTLNFLIESPAKIKNPDSLVCLSPENVKGMTWAKAYSYYNPSKLLPWLVEILFFIIGVTDLIVLLLLLYFTIRACFSEVSVIIVEFPGLFGGYIPYISRNTPSVENEEIELQDMIPDRLADLPPSYDDVMRSILSSRPFCSLPDLLRDPREQVNKPRIKRSWSTGDVLEAVSSTPACTRRPNRRLFEI